MLATSLHTGNRREGYVSIVVNGSLTFGYRYSFGTGRAKHDLHIAPCGGMCSPGPLGDALSEIVSRIAESRDPGPTEWSIDKDAAGYTVTARRAA